MADPDTLGGIGELATLARIFPRLPSATSELLGPGDDCAVVAAPDGRFVVTTDMMIHGPDFRLAWSTPHDLGWKAAATNLSDVAIAAPESTPVEVLERIADGLRDGCAALAPGCGVVGGDLSASPTLTIAVTAFGDLDGRPPVTRSGARVGDVVAVSGSLGLAGRGLSLLFAGAVVDGEPDVEAARQVRAQHPQLVDAQLAPRPPISDGVAAATAGATSMIDLSDGLALDASRVARASGVRMSLDSALLGDEPAWALSGGEDHSLLATFPPQTALPGGFHRIGVVRAGLLSPGLEVDGTLWDGRSGWDPYRGWDGGAG